MLSYFQEMEDRYAQKIKQLETNVEDNMFKGFEPVEEKQKENV